MNYSTFITIESFYDPLCSSDLVSDQWINYNNDFLISTKSIYDSNDYRVSAGRQFQLLSMFCQQARQTVNVTLQTFLQT